MAILSMVDVAGLAFDAGLRDPVKLAQAVAIATAESGRNPNQLGDLTLQTATWGPSVGLWQIRSLKAEKGKGTTRDQDRLTDPAANAKAMFEISGGGMNWSPWTVTKISNPAGYMRYATALPLATNPVAQMLATKAVHAVTDTAQAAAAAPLQPVEKLAATISDIAQTPIKISNWLTQSGTWIRVGYLLIGGVLLVLGLGMVVRQPILAATSATIQTVAPIGKAVKTIKKVG